jgi:rubrerythrin
MTITGYSDRFVESPDELNQNKRWWWCKNCGAVFTRHHSQRQTQFCVNCEDRHALLIELKAIGKGNEKVD